MAASASASASAGDLFAGADFVRLSTINQPKQHSAVNIRRPAATLLIVLVDGLVFRWLQIVLIGIAGFTSFPSSVFVATCRFDCVLLVNFSIILNTEPEIRSMLLLCVLAAAKELQIPVAL